MEERKMERSLTGEKRIYEAPLTPVNIWNDGRGENKGLEEGGKKEGERWRASINDTEARWSRKSKYSCCFFFNHDYFSTDASRSLQQPGPI